MYWGRIWGFVENMDQVHNVASVIEDMREAIINCQVPHFVYYTKYKINAYLPLYITGTTN